MRFHYVTNSSERSSTDSLGLYSVFNSENDQFIIPEGEPSLNNVFTYTDLL